MAFIDEKRVSQLFVKGSQVSDGAIPWLVRYFQALCFGTALLFRWGRRASQEVASREHPSKDSQLFRAVQATGDARPCVRNGSAPACCFARHLFVIAVARFLLQAGHRGVSAVTRVHRQEP